MMNLSSFGKVEITAMLSVVLASCSVVRGCTDGAARGAKMMQGSVDVLGAWEVDLHEISGVGLRKVSGAATAGGASKSVAVDEVFFVSDQESTLLVGSGVIGRDWEKSLRRLPLVIPAADSENAAPNAGKNVGENGVSGPGSYFEAVAGDVTGMIVVMSEESSLLRYFAGDGSLVKTVALRIPDDSPLRKDWDADPGSRGEGLVLLNNGHVLVLKEKNPALVIEFGLAKDSAAGYEPGDAMVSAILAPPRRMSGGQSAHVVVEEKTVSVTEEEFVPLKWWRPNAAAKTEAHDLSELTVTAKGRLIALSDRDVAIFEVEKKLDLVEEKFHFKCRWDLPAQINKPEGMVALRDGSLLLALDRKKGGPNVFRIQLGACI